MLPSCVATQQDTQILSQQVQAINSKLYKLNGIREKQAELRAELDSLRMELQRMSGALEENQRLTKHVVERDTTALDALNAQLATLEEKVLRLNKQLNLESPLQPQKQTPATPRPPALEGMSALPEKALYEETLNKFREKKYEDAIAGFKDLIQTFPASHLADNALFWIGEAYMAMNQPELAIHAYQEVITKYPRENKAPNAMLKQALAFVKVKDNIAAKIVLKNLIKQYPDSEESRLAEEQLKALR